MKYYVRTDLANWVGPFSTRDEAELIAASCDGTTHTGHHVDELRSALEEAS